MTCTHPKTCPQCLADRVELVMLRNFESHVRSTLATIKEGKPNAN